MVSGVRSSCETLATNSRLELLAPALLGDIVDDDEHAALRVVGRERGHEQLQLPLADGLLRLDILRSAQGQERVKLGLLRRKFRRRSSGCDSVLREHLRGGGVIVDDAARRC